MKIHHFALLLLLSLCYLNPVQAQSVEFFEGSWAEVNEKAAKENKWIFLDAYTDWCYWCKVMEKKSFTNPMVADFINENFVATHIDFEKGEGIKLAMKFRVMAFPTILIFNPGGQLIGNYPGYIEDPQVFVDMLQTGLNRKEERLFAYDSRELDLAYPDFLYEVYGANGRKKFPKTEEIETWISEQDDPFSELVWSALQPRGAGEKMNTFFLNNYEQYKKLYGRIDTENLVNTITYHRLKKAKKKKDEELMEEALALCDLLEHRGPQIKLINKSQFYQETGDLKAWANQIDQLAGEFCKGSEFMINDAAWTIFEKHDEEWLLSKAVTWMESVIENKPEDYAYLDTYVAVLYKSGDYKLAMKWATEAIRIGKSQEEDVTGTENLIKKIEKAIGG